MVNKYRNFIGKEAQKGPINEIRWQRRFWDFTSHLLFVCGCLCIAHECECQKTTCRSLFSFFTRLVPRKWTQGHQAWQQTPLPTEPSSSSAQLWGFTRQMELEPKPINNGDPLRLHFQMSYCEKCLWMKKRWWWKMQRRTKAKKIWKSNGSQTTKTKLALVRLEKKKTLTVLIHISERKSRKCKSFSVKQSWMKYTRKWDKSKTQFVLYFVQSPITKVWNSLYSQKLPWTSFWSPASNSSMLRPHACTTTSSIYMSTCWIHGLVVQARQAFFQLSYIHVQS